MKTLIAALVILCAMTASAATNDPNAVYGTITGYDPATMTIVLLDGAITVDASKAYIVDTTGLPGVPPAVGLQSKIILRPGPYTIGAPLPAALVELTTRTPASMAGTVTSIDLSNNSFTAAGLTIRVTAQTKWRGRQGLDVRSLNDLRVGYALTAELVKATATLNTLAKGRLVNNVAPVPPLTIATDINVIGEIPPSNHYTFGKVISVDGKTWVVRDTDGNTHVFQTFDRTIFNSNALVQAEPRVGEYVSVTSYPDDQGVEIALVISVMAPPSPQRGIGMFGTLLEINQSEKFLAIAGVPGGTREEFAITGETGFYLGAKVGDYVEVRADFPKVNDRLTALQVIKTTSTIRLGIQGVVESITGDTWMIEGWTVIVTPQTILINNPRVGDVVKVTGESERGSNTIRAISIERI